MALDIPANSIVLAPDGQMSHYDHQQRVQVPVLKGWWASRAGRYTYRELDGSGLELPDERTPSLALRHGAYVVAAPVSAALDSGLSNDCVSVEDGCPEAGPLWLVSCHPPDLIDTRDDLEFRCGARVVVTTIARSPAFHHGDTLAALRASPNAHDARLAHFYVADGGTIVPGLPMHISSFPPDDPRHTDVVFAVEMHGGSPSAAALQGLVALLDLVEDRGLRVPRAIGGPDLAAGIALPAGFDRHDLCAALLARGDGMVGCGATLGAHGTARWCGHEVLPNALEVECHDPSVSDLTPLMGRDVLRRIDLSGSGVRDISALGTFASLDFVSLARTPVDDLRPLMKTPVRTLDLSDSHVWAIWPTRLMLKLESLTLTHTPVPINDYYWIEEKLPTVHVVR